MASRHKVVKGETLSSIAKKYGITLAQIKKLNPQITNPNLINVGQLINYTTTKLETTDPATAVADELKGLDVKNEQAGFGPGSATDTSTETAGKIAAINAYGLTLDLLKLFPSLQAAYNAFIRGDKTQAQLEYYKSSYYQNVTDVGQARAKNKASRPGVYKQELEAYTVTQRSRLAAAGIADVSDETLETAYLSGWTEKQLDLNALSKVTKNLTGDTLGTAQDLKKYADSYGMSYNAMTYDIWSKALFAGTTSIEDMKNKIRQDSASAFPVFADQINAGKSLDSLASAYKSSIANILEKDPDTISWSDPNLRKALQNVDKDGKAILMPIWQFEKNLRSTTEWEYTNNARDTMNSLALKVLRDWGLA